MNKASFVFSTGQLSVFRELVAAVHWDRPDLVGLRDLKLVLDTLRPGRPHTFEPALIAAADEAFALATNTELPEKLTPTAQDDFRHLKAIVAAAAVD